MKKLGKFAITLAKAVAIVAVGGVAVGAVLSVAMWLAQWFGLDPFWGVASVCAVILVVTAYGYVDEQEGG